MCCEGGKKAVCGGVIRDHEGCWIGGFAYEKCLGSVISAKLYGILYGLKLARGKGIKKIWLESDSSMALDLVDQGCLRTHPCANVEWEITKLLAILHHVYRKLTIVLIC